MLEQMDEFKKRYENTYLFCTIEGQPKELVYIKRVTEDSVEAQTENNGSYFVSKNSEVEFEVAWPERGLFNYNGKMAWANRVPDRQWKRAIAGKNIELFYPVTYTLLSKQQTPDIAIGWNSLKAAFAPREYTTISAAAKKLARTWSSISLNNNWGLSLSSKVDIKGYFLWHNLRICGIVDVKNKTIAVTFPALWQEISDFNRDYEDDVWTLTLHQ